MPLYIICTVIVTLLVKGINAKLAAVPAPSIASATIQGGSEWKEWQQWSSCNGTIQRRSRICKGGNCIGASEQIRLCSQLASEVLNSDDEIVTESQWGEWSKFGLCSVSCGGGFQTRTRLCYEKCPGCGCNGPSAEQRYCNAEDCCEWTSWSGWSQCSVTCGTGGYRYRTRQCTCEQCPNGEASEQTYCTAAVPCMPITRTRICTFQLVKGFPIRIC